MKKRNIVFFLAAAGLITIYFALLFSSPFIKKPLLDKPAEDTLTGAHFCYIVNEIGGYKLHKNPLTQETPLIGFNISSSLYLVAVNENLPEPRSVEENAPDIVIVADSDTILDILELEEVNDGIITAISENRLQIFPLVDKTVLFMKGYESIFSAIEQNSNPISGMATSKMIRDLSPASIKDAMSILVLLLIILSLEQMLK